MNYKGLLWIVVVLSLASFIKAQDFYGDGEHDYSIYDSAEDSQHQQSKRNELFKVGPLGLNKDICLIMCGRNPTAAMSFCNCKKQDRRGASYKRYQVDCQVLCFIGQGGKMCKCNYAPFVGK